MPAPPLSRVALLTVICLLVGGIFTSELLTPLGLAVWVFYLVPIGLTLRLRRPGVPFVIGALCSALVVLAYFVSPGALLPLSLVQLNRLFGIVALLGTGALIERVVDAQRAMEQVAALRALQAAIAERVRGELGVVEVAEHVLGTLVERLGATVGACYVDTDEGRFARTATWAVPDPSALPERFTPGESLLGQAARDGRPLLLGGLETGHLRMGSALGMRSPRTVAVLPCQADGRTRAVVELGFAEAPQLDLTEAHALVGESIAVAVRSALYRQHLRELLESSQRQTQELQAQGEELRVLNEELEEQSNALRQSQARLEMQQTELSQTNEHLEEQTTLLARQKEGLDRRNAELATAQADLERSAAELRLANRYKSEFLANMSHELRTPLNSTLILARLLAENPGGNLTEEQVGFAKTIVASGNDLLELINEILDLAKVEAGRLEIVPEEIAPHTILARLERVFVPIARDNGLVLRAEAAADLPAVISTDARRLEQVLRNFLSNAVKFTETGEVVLSASRIDPPPGAEGSFVAFSVRDTGIGIPNDKQDVVFEAFRQADGTTNRRYGGTGLGLTIARDIARLLGGDILLESEPGRGSTFTLRIPERLAAPESPETNRPPPTEPTESPAGPAVRQNRPAPHAASSTLSKGAPSEPGGERPRTLLVVEDDPRFAAVLEATAKELDFRCLIARTAEEGLALARTRSPDAVVLDVHLPDASGLSVLDRLKADPATRHLPVHVISVEDHARAALHMGAIGYLLKPSDPAGLRAALSRIEQRLTRRMSRVLVVEDDPVQREAVCRLIAHEDIETVAVGTGAEALEQLRTSTFDCVVLDLSLPDMHGEELLSRLGSEEGAAFPPVVVYTGRELTRDEEAALQRYSTSIVIKGARSPERLLDEVTLFLHQVERELPADQQQKLRRARLREKALDGRTILLVDDDVRNLFALTSVFEQRGARVEVARNGREALQVLERGAPIDLVLMDIMMPEMDGYEAMRRIRADPRFARLPIIAVTARAMRDDQERCREAGADDHLSKPVDVDRLLSLVRVWLQRRRNA